MFAVAEERQKNDASEVKKMLNVCSCRGQKKNDASERRGSMFADTDDETKNDGSEGDAQWSKQERCASPFAGLMEED
jgi:hypothetical protein